MVDSTKIDTFRPIVAIILLVAAFVAIPVAVWQIIDPENVAWLVLGFGVMSLARQPTILAARASARRTGDPKQT